MSKLFKYLRKRKIKNLRLTWCDNANIIRAKVFPIDAIDTINQTGVSLSQAAQAVPVMHDQVLADAKLAMTHNILLKPDWLSFHLLPHMEASGCVMSRMMDHSLPWALCPRQFLTNMIRKLFEKTGLTLQLGFDQTFQLLDPLDEELDYTHEASQKSLDKFDLLLTDLGEVLKTINLQPNLFHSSAGGNRFMFSFAALDPLVTADNQILLRQVLHGISLKYGLQSSFLPVLSENDRGNGSVLRFTLHQNNKNVTFNKEVLSEMTSHFMAGILYHLPDLMCLTLPTTNSLRRLKPKHAVGCYPVWGYENSEAVIEVPKHSALQTVKEIMFKAVDASANPYYALAGMIACGLDGIEKKMFLPRPVEYDPSLLSKHDNIKALPIELGEVLRSVERSPFFRNMMGDSLFTAYLAVKKAEYEFFQEKTFEEEVSFLKFIY